MQAKIDFPLPSNLPKPIDDGAAKHLTGMAFPNITLTSTAGREVRVAEPKHTRTVLFCYPMTGVPGKPLPEGWDMIPGARGCTPQTCGFRDLYREFMDLQTQVFGVSTQSTEYQREMATRLHLPFEVLSDAKFELCDALRLPTFDVEGKRLMKRLTLIVREKKVEHVLYPVFPPNESADQTLQWIEGHPLGSQ